MTGTLQAHAVRHKGPHHEIFHALSATCLHFTNLACKNACMSQAQTVPLKVRAAMSKAGLRQADLAGPLEISQQQVSARLNGKVDFTVRELEIVAETLGVELTTLIAGEPVEAAS